jgi:thymidylate synthase (FAD)
MKLIKPSYEILSMSESLLAIELAARTCYKSEDRITEGSAEKLAAQLIESKHEAMIEFADITVKFICDRGVSHEIVRHRLASYAQESTRYCNYSKDKFDNELTFIIPEWLNLQEGYYPIDPTSIPQTDAQMWLMSMSMAEEWYMSLIATGWSAQKARSVLPHSIKTEVVMKANIREWRHFFKLRCANAAHPQMRELTIPLLKELKSKIPVLFDDINY